MDDFIEAFKEEKANPVPSKIENLREWREVKDFLDGFVDCEKTNSKLNSKSSSDFIRNLFVLKERGTL